MEVVVANDKQQWNNFLLQNPRDGLFLQSWEWGETLQATGQNVKRLQVLDGSSVVAQAQIVVKSLPFGISYSLAAKGPVVTYHISHNTYQTVYEVLAAHLKNNNCIFLRIEPAELKHDTGYMLREVKDINPPATLVLDITPDENQLLVNMHEKTRYNIRLAEKKGLRVTEQHNFDIFWDLLQKTGQRDDFTLHSKESYQAIMSSESVRQIIVWNGETPVATAGLIGFSDTMYYLYGASDHAYRQLMGPHLMQWEAIKLAKKLGYKKYDFFGIAPRVRHPEEKSDAQASETTSGSPGLLGTKNNGIATLPPVARNDAYDYDPKHRYAGVTRFKLGFGGAVHEEPGTFDLIIDKNKYRMYQALRIVRKIF